MKKTVWIIIQDNSLPENGSHNRHFYTARYLAKRGYEPIVFVASKARCSSKQMIDDDTPYRVDESYGFPFVYIRTRTYEESMKERLRAMVEFHVRLHKCAKQFPKPDVILGSSAYPLSPLLAIKLAKKYRCKSICEIRDLWPLSLEEYGLIRPNGIIARMMYRLEKYLYIHSDEIVFTFEGGKDYIVEKGFDTQSGGAVDLDKVYCIGNGVDLEEFSRNEQEHPFQSDVLSTYDGHKVVYAGSVRKANSLGFLLDVATILKNYNIAFFIFGDGIERAALEKRCEVESIDNVHFFGKIDKRQIPSALAQGTMAIMYSNTQNSLSRYGMSQNKLAEYLASGKPILSNLPSQYSVINQYDCGREVVFHNPEACANYLRDMLQDPKALAHWSNNARETARLFSYEKLTERLIYVIERNG